MTTATDQTQFNDLRQRLRKYLADTGKSQEYVGSSIDKTSSVVSQFLSGQYKGDNDKIATLLEQFLDLESERSSVPHLDEFVQTRVSRSIVQLCNYCHSHNTGGLVTADAGMGKTMSVQEYARRHAGVVLLTCNSLWSGKGAVTRHLSNKVLGRDNGRIDELIEELVKKLGGSGRLVIFDEAHHLSSPGLDEIKAITDRSGIGFVLLGLPYLAETMTGGRNFQWFAQISSRLGIRRSFKLPIGSEAKRLQRRDAKSILSAIVPGATTEAVNHLVSLSCQPGAFRRVRQHVGMALHLAKTGGGDVDEKLIGKAMTQLKG